MGNSSIIPISKRDIDIVMQAAPIAAASRLYGVTVEQAAIIMLSGKELGIGMFGAFQFVHVIDGKPSLSPKGCLALIHASGEEEYTKITDENDKNGYPYSCTVTMKRIGQEPFTTKYTMDDAKRAGLVKEKSAWEKYPANMLRWRAVGYCADIVYPDILGGMYRPEELGADVDADGEVNVIEGEYTQTQIQEQMIQAVDDLQFSDSDPVKVSDPVVVTVNDSTAQSLADLIAKGYTPVDIMAVNNNKIPGTADECAKIEKLLEERNAGN